MNEPFDPERVTPGELTETQEEGLRLAEAFRIFNQASEELSTAYTSLQAQVAELTSELAAANGALRQQYQEKAALTERLSLLLSALPAGVMVLDAAGQIVEANPAAGQMLGVLPGQSWPELERTQLVACDTPGECMVSVSSANSSANLMPRVA